MHTHENIPLTKIADNARMRRGKILPINVLVFNPIPEDSLEGLILGLPNGRTYVPMDAEQLRAKIIEALVSNSTIQITSHPQILQEIARAEAHLAEYKVIERTVVNGHKIELIHHPDLKFRELLRWHSNGRYHYTEMSPQFIMGCIAFPFRQAVLNFLLEKTFS